MALKSVDDVDGNEFDDELSTTEIAYLAKNFRNFLRNNNRRVRGNNNAEPRNFRRNNPTKVNNTEKPKEKVGQTSNNSMGQQCFGFQGYGHVKSKCPTFLSSKGKVMAITLSDDEVSDHESGNDEDENFIAFTTTAILEENVVVDENLSDGELSESADLQDAYNKLCKVVAKDAMNVDLGLQKITSLELDKKYFLLKLLNANVPSSLYQKVRFPHEWAILTIYGDTLTVPTLVYGIDSEKEPLTLDGFEIERPGFEKRKEEVEKIPMDFAPYGNNNVVAMMRKMNYLPRMNLGRAVKKPIVQDLAIPIATPPFRLGYKPTDKDLLEMEVRKMA